MFAATSSELKNLSHTEYVGAAALTRCTRLIIFSVTRAPNTSLDGNTLSQRVLSSFMREPSWSAKTRYYEVTIQSVLISITDVQGSHLDDAIEKSMDELFKHAALIDKFLTARQ